MAGVLELSNLDLQCTIRRNKNTGGERKERRTHRTRAPRMRGSRGGPARASSGGQRRRWIEARLRRLGQKKRTLDGIGDRGGVRALFMGMEFLGRDGIMMFVVEADSCDDMG